jgi:dTDP-4-amino-4,6-dideoxygalactose transaminase
MADVTSVDLLDLRRGLPEIERELEDAFRRVLRSGRYILGPEVQAFESTCAAYVGSRHAIGVSSGTDALLLALMALGVRPGDEVLCPTYSFFATAGVVWRVGARPVFVDSCPGCFNCLPGDIEARATERTTAFIAVHLFGQSAEMAPILDFAARRQIPVIEDAAQALGAEYNGRRVGTLGRAGCFSFFPSKNLGAFGDAGLVTTDDDDLAERMRVLRTHGGKPKYYHAVVGANFRIDALQAALLSVKLPRLDGYTRRRQENADAYRRLLEASGLAATTPCRCRGESGPPAQAPIGLPGVFRSRHIYNQFVVRLGAGRDRDRVRRHLAGRKVGTEIYYPVPMHLQACFASLGHREGDFPFAEAAARETLALPIFPELTAAEIDYVAENLLQACREGP